MKKGILLLVVSVCFLGLAVGCDVQNVQGTAVVELEGNATTGYSWQNSITPDGVVKEVSSDYKPNGNDLVSIGVGGTYTFTFESVAQGEAEIKFYYSREWEDVPPLDEAIYKATVDADGNLELKLVKGPSGF